MTDQNSGNENIKPDLKETLHKKEAAFHVLKDHLKRKIKEEKGGIAEEKEGKLDEATQKLQEDLEKIDKNHEKALAKLKRQEASIDRHFGKQERDAREYTEKTHRDINKDAEKASQEIEEELMKEIEAAKKELISIKRRVYSTRRKIINAMQFIGVIYLFIFSIILMKDVAVQLSGSAINTITNAIDTPASAFGAGWLGAILAQSASVIAILSNTLVGSGIINFDTAFYILLGLTLGNSVTPILASLVIKSENHWDLRHGFELGLANVVYAFFLVIIIFLIQITTGLFTYTGTAVNDFATGIPVLSHIPSLLDVITDPIKNTFHIYEWPTAIVFVLAIFLLIFSLQRVGKSMFIFMGGKRHTRAIMQKYLNTYWKAFLIGLALTMVIPSASLLVTLMVPLAITRIITLRQAIPYMIGTNVGTFIDVLLASFANAQPFAIAGGVVLTLMSAFGILFIFKNFGSNLVYRVTRHISLHLMHMKKRNIVIFLVGFILAPTTILVIF
ncbi:hypothetical protein KKD70_00270 [Patescibacteria group bacterium]|nr:hypothetical protein [Patescibacteria group bacterium]